MNDFNTAVQVSALGLGGVFGFMLLFYGVIRVIDWLFPKTEHHHEEH